MKALICAIVLCFVLAGVAAADAPGKVTIDAKAMAVKDAIDALSKQSGTAIVMDPKATGSVTVSLNGAELSQALDVVTKSNNLTWKKLQFARKEDSKVSLDQLKSGILALASMPLVGLSVQDPATKTATLYAKDIPAAQEVVQPALPEGYSWSTVYVVLAPEPVAAPGSDKVAELGKVGAKQMQEIVRLSTEERQQYFQSLWTEQMRLTPEARQGMLRDQFAAMRNLDQQSQEQLRSDMRSVFGGMRGQFGGRDGQNSQGEGRERSHNRGN